MTGWYPPCGKVGNGISDSSTGWKWSSSGSYGFSFGIGGGIGVCCLGASFTYGFSFTNGFSFFCFFTGIFPVGTLIFMPGISRFGSLKCEFILFNCSKSTLYFFAISQSVSPFCTMWIFTFDLPPEKSLYSIWVIGHFVTFIYKVISSLLYANGFCNMTFTQSRSCWGLQLLNPLFRRFFDVLIAMRNLTNHV